MEKVILHAGCGGASLPEWLDGREVRLDINPDVRPRPDVVASLTSLGEIGPFDAIYCSHTLEHLYPWDGDIALKEFLRVLKPKGSAIIAVPDLTNVEATEEILYESLSGPISGLDMIYGWRKAVQYNPYMEHHNGFVPETLEKMLVKAGFSEIKTIQYNKYELLGIAVK